MTISSALNAGVAGLAANATQLATISDNIANSSTYGYKRVETDFHSMVINGGTGSFSGAYSAGGVRATTNRIIDQDGALITTSNPTDLAVRGRGFIPVTTESKLGTSNGENPLYLTTTGSFRADKNGILKTESGLVLLGWPANTDGTISNFPRDTADGLQAVRINNNQLAGEPTTKMALSANLPATQTAYGAVGDTETWTVVYYDNLSRAQTLTFSFTPTLPANSGDPETNTWTMDITDSASAGASIGNYTLVFADARTGGGTLQSVTVNSGTTTYDPVTGDVSVEVAAGPISINIGAIGDGSEFTQLSNDFSPGAISKDGSPVGKITTVEVDANGYVYANFDTGISRVIYQIPLIDMPNPNGLIALDNQTYQTSQESGSIYLWDAGDGPTGDIVSYALEESATDVAHELTTLIQTQRAYSSNAKVIQTVDEMLQETTNLKR